MIYFDLYETDKTVLIFFPMSFVFGRERVGDYEDTHIGWFTIRRVVDKRDA